MPCHIIAYFKPYTSTSWFCGKPLNQEAFATKNSPLSIYHP